MSRHPSRRLQSKTFGSQARRANGSGEGQIATDFDELKMLLESSDQEPMVVKGPIHLSTHHEAMEIPSEPVTRAELAVEFPTGGYVSQPDGSVLFKNSRAYQKQVGDVTVNVQEPTRNISVSAQAGQTRRGMEEVTAEPPMVQNASVTQMDVSDRRIETLPNFSYCTVNTVKDKCDSMEVLLEEILKDVEDSMRVIRSEGGHRMTVSFWEDTPGMRAYAAYLNEVLDRQTAPDLIIWIRLPYGLIVPTYQLRGAMMEHYHVKVHTLHNTFMLGD